MCLKDGRDSIMVYRVTVHDRPNRKVKCIRSNQLQALMSLAFCVSVTRILTLVCLGVNMLGPSRISGHVNLQIRLNFLRTLSYSARKVPVTNNA